MARIYRSIAQFGLAMGVAILMASTADAQIPTEPMIEATDVEEIIVIARRSGAPTWTVTEGEATVLLVGSIRDVPEQVEWHPAALENAARRSDRILFPQRPDISPADILRIIWRSRTLALLPTGKTSADYLSPVWQARLDVLGDRHDQDWSRQSFFLTANDLLFDTTGLRRGRGTDINDVVRRAAREGRVPIERVGQVRGDDLIDGLLERGPETWLPCVHASIVAAEAGPDAVLDRGRAWVRFDIAEVMASPVEIALGQCWPYDDSEIGPLVRSQWTVAIDRALTEPGVTLAVVPLRLLATPGGMLDTLEGRGLEIRGPEWRAAPAD